MLAISAYEKQLVSFGSRYDEYLSDRKHKTLTFSELKGEQFFLKNCSHCHVVYSKEKSILNNNVENNYSVSDVVDMSDLGLYETTKIEADKHKFRVPTLRNIALTAPYFHNGSVEKLEIAMLHSKPTIDAVEKKALLLFLNTLTDSTIFTNPLFRKLQIIEKTIAPSQPSPRGKE